MSDDIEPQDVSQAYVPGFLYLDMDLVKSISARMGRGYVKEQIKGSEEMEQESESIRARIMASIFNIGADIEGQITQTEADTSHSESVKGLHHYHFTLLESALEQVEGEWFHDLNAISTGLSNQSARERIYKSETRDLISEGDIIRAQGDIELSDVSTSLDMIRGMLSMMDKMQQINEIAPDVEMNESFNDDPQFEDMDFDAQKKFFDLLLDIVDGMLPGEYKNMIIAELFPLEGNRDHTIWSILDGDKLEGEPVELMAKYEKRDIPNCTLLARVDTITNDPVAYENEDDIDSDQIGMLHHFADDFASDMGLKVTYPSISVTPIAIYR